MADQVLGQTNFINDIVTSVSISIVSTEVDNTGGVDTTPTPTSLAWDGTNLYVADPFNRRILLFTPADSLIPSAFDTSGQCDSDCELGQRNCAPRGNGDLLHHRRRKDYGRRYRNH